MMKITSMLIGMLPLKKTLSNLEQRHCICLLKNLNSKNYRACAFYIRFNPKKSEKSEAVEKNIHDDGDEYHISDRLSFHYLRQNEEVINDDFFKTPYCALLCLEVKDCDRFDRCHVNHQHIFTGSSRCAVFAIRHQVWLSLVCFLPVVTTFPVCNFGLIYLRAGGQ